MFCKQFLCFKLFLCFFFLFPATALADENDAVTYDKRSLLINGSRELLFSGSIHYPRSTPDMWPQLISKAKHGGINVIDTYVFWNIHEPVEGQFNFEGRYDLVKFLKIVQEQGLYVILRIGPFVESEWNFGGFPYWLREIPGIIFRSDNKPFKTQMKRYAKMIVKKMKDNKMYASQGGPIILSQVENEYNMVQLAFKEKGVQYVKWAAKMAVGLKTGVPWIMCKQKDAPDPVINTCNGRNCGDTFTGPNAPNKPSLWTENWTAQYRVFGDPPSQRSAEDLAFAVARWFSKDGTLVNYYMYHGGTNFGRTGSSFVTTRYYDEAPIDEYGMLKEPKWGHLRDLHSALRLCRKALFRGNSQTISLGDGQQARVYEKPGSNICAAFLTNNKTREPSTVVFRNVKYYLPPRSISILPDCKTVVFNTAKVNAQHNARFFYPSDEANKNMQWQEYQEKIPSLDESSFRSTILWEHLNMTKDTTDYLWYTTNFEVDCDELSTRSDIRPVIQIASLGHAMHAFVNGQYIGSGHGSNIDKSFTFSKAIPLKSGDNEIALLGMTVGLPNSGAYLEHKLSGIHSVQIQGLNSGMKSLSNYNWGYQIGMLGEKFRIYKQRGTKRVDWSEYKGSANQAITWYKRYFDAPAGKDPVVIDLSSMGKGQVWVNGESIGRYWISYLTPLGKPSQALYHIPRSFMRETQNLLVIFEESGGDPSKIAIAIAVRDTICSIVSESNPGHVKSWKREESEIRTVDNSDLNPKAHLKCPSKKVIESIEFASFGNSIGVCGNFTAGNCTAPATKSVVEKACLGKTSCVIPALQEHFGQDPCPETPKILAVQARCTTRGGNEPDEDDAIDKY